MSGTASSLIKFGRFNTMSLTDAGWKISIKNADGTRDEVLLEPKLPEARVEVIEDVEKDAEHDSTVNGSPCCLVSPISRFRMFGMFGMFTDHLVLPL